MLDDRQQLTTIRGYIRDDMNKVELNCLNPVLNDVFFLFCLSGNIYYIKLNSSTEHKKIRWLLLNERDVKKNGSTLCSREKSDDEIFLVKNSLFSKVDGWREIK